MRFQILPLFITLLLLLSSCSTTDSAGATGVGNPSEVALIATTGDITSQGGFENSSRALLREPKVLSDSQRDFTVESISLLVDKMSWQIDTASLAEEYDPKLSLEDEQLVYDEAITFDALNPNQTPISIDLPSAGYKKIRLFLNPLEEEKASITMKGHYTNDDNVEVPFSFEMPYTIELKFEKTGPHYYWDTESSVRIDIYLDLDKWFTGLDILDSLKVEGNSTTALTKSISDFTGSSQLPHLRNNIRQSGVLSIYEK